MKVLVASTNPVKLNAVKTAFSHYFEDVEVKGIEVESGVSHTPLTDEEIVKGALNRVNTIFDETYDYCVGIEGGCNDTKHGMELYGWVAILNKDKELGLGCAAKMMLPKHIAKRMRQGENLGDAIDDIMNDSNIAKKNGVIGVLTKDVITRTDFLVHGAVFALAHFVNKELYK